jgi:hypothetical protein
MDGMKGIRKALEESSRIDSLQHFDGLLSCDSGKIVQKLIERNPLFQVVKKALYGDARAAKDRRPAKYFRVDVNNFAHTIEYTTLIPEADKNYAQ